MEVNAAQIRFRESLIDEVYRCECCGIEPHAGLRNTPLQVHEIARGNFRSDALDKRFAVLVLCDPCHGMIHRMAGDDQRALGLALLRRNRPNDYNLPRFHALTDRNYPSDELVMLWYRRLDWNNR